MRDKSAAQCKKAWSKFEVLYGKPKLLLSDNADELKIPGVEHTSSPSNHPEANARLERMHKELGKLYRIHGVKPNEAVQFLWDHESLMVLCSQFL